MTTRRFTYRDRTTLMGGLVLLGAALIRLPGLDKGPWLDEFVTLEIVRVASWREWAHVAFSDVHPLAYPVILTVWAQVSVAEAWLRALSAAISLATIAVAMAWAHDADRRAAPLTGLVLATSPIVLRYSHELRGYALLVLATAVSGWAASRLVRARPSDERTWVATLLAALATCALTSSVGLLLLPAVVAAIVFAADTPRAGRRRIPWRGLAVVGSSSIALYALQWLRLGSLVPRLWMPPLSAGFLRASVGELFGVTRPGAPVPATPEAAFVCVVILALTLLFVFARSRGTWRSPLAMALTYWAALGAVSLVVQPVWWPRTLLPGLVPLAVAVGCAVVALPTRVSQATAALLLLAGSFAGAASWLAFGARHPLEAWKAALADLGSASPQSHVFCVPPYVHVPVRALLPGLQASLVEPIDARESSADLARRVDAACDGLPSRVPVWIVVRVDAVLARDASPLARLVSSMAAPCADRPVSAVLLNSPDVNLLPWLGHAARGAEATIIGGLRRPATRLPGAGFVRLDFPP